MSKKEKFIAETTPRYTAKGHFFTLGKGILDGEVIPEVDVNIPLRTINRHGLVASLVMDIKGDLSGIAVSGEMNSRIQERYEKTKLPYQPQAFPVELMSLSAEKGVKLRATVTEFGPVL